MPGSDIILSELYRFCFRGFLGFAIPHQHAQQGDFNTPTMELVDGYYCDVWLDGVDTLPFSGLEQDNAGSWFLEPKELIRPVTEYERKVFLLKTKIK